MTGRCIIEFVDRGWPRYHEVERLIYENLYREFDVPQEADWRHTAEHEVHVVALCDGVVSGNARLLGRCGEDERQMRQVVVAEKSRRTGIGRALVLALEERARDEGARAVWLNARESAYPFYLGLGYRFTGETFVSELTQLPHRPMRKEL